MFEKLLSRGERRFGRYFGIPKLMMILCIGMGVTYVADYLLAAYNISLSYYLMFDREAIFHGQIWRLVSFIFMPPSSSPVFLLISLMVRHCRTHGARSASRYTTSAGCSARFSPA